MKRNEILMRLGYTVPEIKKKRVILHSDIKNEADDHFAIMHHLLTPYVDVKGIIAGHFNYFPSMIEASGKEITPELEHIMPRAGTTALRSYQEGIKILELAQIEDVPLFHGSEIALKNVDEIPESEGADFIIEEAMRDDPKPLFIALMGNITDLAIAYLKEPKIAERLTAIWIGGAAYPDGGQEFNLRQDVIAARVVFDSPIPVWQVPSSVYASMEISFAELMYHVKPCGDIGSYLCQQMFDFNNLQATLPGAENRDFPHGEIWSIGDNPTLSVLMQNAKLKAWHVEKAPMIKDDLTYEANPQGKEIRVYDWIDTRLSIQDLFAKLSLCYK